MIGPRHVLTAAHAVYIDLEDYGGPPGFTNIVSDIVVDAFIEPAYLEIANFSFDYAVLILADAVETATLGWWQLCTPSSAFLMAGTFQLAGYPGNANQCELSPHPEGL